jgi:hypothetical protein
VVFLGGCLLAIIGFAILLNMKIVAVGARYLADCIVKRQLRDFLVSHRVDKLYADSAFRVHQMRCRDRNEA